MRPMGNKQYKTYDGVRLPKSSQRGLMLPNEGATSKSPASLEWAPSDWTERSLWRHTRFFDAIFYFLPPLRKYGNTLCNIRNADVRGRVYLRMSVAFHSNSSGKVTAGHTASIQASRMLYSFLNFFHVPLAVVYVALYTFYRLAPVFRHSTNAIPFAYKLNFILTPTYPRSGYLSASSSHPFSSEKFVSTYSAFLCKSLYHFRLASAHLTWRQQNVLIHTYR